MCCLIIICTVTVFNVIEDFYVNFEYVNHAWRHSYHKLLSLWTPCCHKEYTRWH